MWHFFLPNCVSLPKSACFSLLSETLGSCLCILYVVSDYYIPEICLLKGETKLYLFLKKNAVYLILNTSPSIVPANLKTSSDPLVHRLVLPRLDPVYV